MGLMLRLRVIDEAGRAVAGATVHHHHEVVATTDDDGVAIVDGIETGWDMVTVSHPMPAEARIPFSLGEGSSGVIERTVTLHRGAPLSGTVVAPDGAPVPGALIEVWCSDDDMQFREADEHGNWGIPAMRAGAFEVRAHADGYAPGPVTSGVHDGLTEQRDVIVRVAIGARLSGCVRERGVPAAGVSIYIESTPADSHMTTTNADGQYELVGLTPGYHHVSAGHGSWTSNVSLGGDGDERILDVELSSTPPGPPAHTDVPAGAGRGGAYTVEQRTSTLIGRVVRDGSPVARFAIRRRGPAPYAWITTPAIITAPDGRFELTGLRAELCTVDVLAGGTAWTSTEPITLPQDATYDLGDIVLAHGLRISGTVCDAAGAPISGARVELGGPGRHDDTLEDALDGCFTTTSAPDGSFVLDGVHLRDPHVRIAAWHPVHGASTHRLLSDHRDPIRIGLVPTGALDGFVEPPTMMGGVLVDAATDEGGGCVARLRPSGHFVVERLLPGDYTVELSQPPRYPPRTARVTIVAGERAFVRIPS